MPKRSNKDIPCTITTISFGVIWCWLWISFQMTDVIQFRKASVAQFETPNTKASVRVYDDLFFTPDFCQTLGVQDYFDTCAVLESCTSQTKEVDEALHDLLQAQEQMENSSQADEALPPNEATYGYRVPGSKHCSWPGPILRMKSGEKHGLFLRGAAEATNLYFHGLHVSNTGTINEQKRSVIGQENLLVYEIDLTNHMGGTHWYHSHVQESAWNHLQGGAFGMIVIDDATDVGTQDANVLDFLKNREQILILDDSHDIISGNYVANGGEHVLQFNADEWYRLRILAVGANSHQSDLTLSFDKAKCAKVHALAYDGIYRFQVPKVKSQWKYSLTTASRLDVAIKCSEDSYIKAGQQAVAQIQVKSNDENNDENNNETATTATPFEEGRKTWFSKRPTYLQDLTSISEVQDFKIRVDETNINDVRQAPLCDESGKDFRYNSTQEWTLKGVSVHPFHVSRYPMQIVSSGCSPDHEVGEFYDTIVAPESTLYNPCVVRLHFVDIDGPTTVQCHTFEHALHGAITWFNVIDDEKTERTDNVGELAPPSCLGLCEETSEETQLCVP